MILFLSYVFLLLPAVNIYHFLTTDDMGRDLYAFQMTLKGKWPCRDYWWQYGPLMPIYYAFWFLVAGPDLVSAKIGLDILLLLSALITYGTIRLFVSPFVAFLFSLAFLSLDVGYTFNHIGCFVFLILSIFSLWKFFSTQKMRWCGLGAFGLIGLSLVKINIGISSSVAFFLSILIYNKLLKTNSPKVISAPILKNLSLIFLIVAGTVLAIYGILYFNLSVGRIDQCMTASGRFFRHWSDFPWLNIPRLTKHFFVSYRRQLIWNLLFSGILLFGLSGLCIRRPLPVRKEILLAVISCPILFGLINATDYFIDGMIFRIYFWLFPMQVLLMGLFAEWGTRLFSRKVKIFLGILIFLIFLLAPIRNLQTAFAYRTPERYIDVPHGRAYVGGHLHYVKALRGVSQFIIENTRPDQEILVLPNDPLICFLSGRKQATWQLNWYRDDINIQRSQEQAIVTQLKSKKVPFVIFSRSLFFEESGTEYLKELREYILRNYQEAKIFQPWKADPPAIDNLVILERILDPPHS